MTYVRFFEILPGALAWMTLLGMVVASRFLPSWAAVFIILFDIYWLLKTVYLSFHLRATYTAMKRNLAVPWRKRLETEHLPWEKLWHLVIFPMYTEPHSVVRESFLKLREAQYPIDRFLVVLALEERGGKAAQETGRLIQEEFGSSFGGFLVTTHPGNLPGEIPGKGSNDTWAVRQAVPALIEQRGISPDDVLVSVFDIDSQIFPEYFGRLSYAYLTVPNPERAIYQPIPLFTNNIFAAPAFARVVSFSSTFWQMMQQARPERLTSFSSQSISLRALIHMGYWHTDVVSEDSRVFWQGLLAYDGDFRVEPLAYPIAMDANVAPTFWKTIVNVYKQHRRWGWGSENIPYMLEGFRTNPRISLRTKAYWTFTVLEGFHSWATNALMIFALGWLPVAIGGTVFNATLLSYNLPRLTRWIVNVSMLGISTSAILSILMLPPRPDHFRPAHYILYVLQWALVPLTLIFLGAIPGLEAQTRLMLGGRWRLGFWVTPKHR